jgi:hypothetical protein
MVWTLLSLQPIECRPLESVSVYSGPFAPDFAPGFAPDFLRSAPKGQVMGEVPLVVFPSPLTWPSATLHEQFPSAIVGTPPERVFLQA